jgi:hypothetical protein
MIHQNCKKYCDENCPSPDKYRCCVKTSCYLVKKEECSEATKKLFDPEKEIPFMTDSGCAVPPHERKYCATFICDYFSESKYYKTHMKLIDKLPIKEKTKWKKHIRFILIGMKTIWKEK